MRKFFTTLLTVSFALSGLTAYAVNDNNPYAPKGDEQVIGKTQVLHNPNKAKKPTLSGADLGAPEGWSIECTVDGKNIESSDKIKIDGTEYQTMKFNNGGLHIVTLPNGCVANSVTIYSVTNTGAATDRPCYWAKVGEETFEKPEIDYLDSYKDFEHPAVSYFKLDGNSNSFELKNSGEQQLVVLVVDYTEGDGTTAVDSLSGKEGTETVVYDLNGRRVNNPSNGIYIVNGKKTYIK